ncbi:MAG TPA: hypothetical protein VFY90_06980, partial [Tepidiformaceae bacterium]|nr:hypothetical protein [Tepidiformaceae bacterium]
MSAALAFWLVALLIAGLALPISFRIFRRLPDAGTGLSFALGLTLAGWGYFILRTLEVLPHGRGGAMLVLGILALVSAGVAGRDRRFLTTLRRTWPAMITVGGVFTVSFFAFVAFRSYIPEIVGT